VLPAIPAAGHNCGKRIISLRLKLHTDNFSSLTQHT
jgi:hypothetical protein